MGNAIIIGILIIIVWRALISAVKHFKGQGGCCGGGDTVKESKKLEDPAIGKKVIQIEGMHCDNCKNRVEHAVNKLDGVVCKVNLKKKTARVSFSKQPADLELKKVIENLGYEVIRITDK